MDSNLRRVGIAVAKAKTYYERWMEKEGVPIVEGFGVSDVGRISLRPWSRLGCDGAYLQLRGLEGITGVYIGRIAPGTMTEPEKHLYEKVIYIIQGEGVAEFQQRGRVPQSIKWKTGSLFSPPLNSTHRLINHAKTPALFVAVTTAPMILDHFHNEQFVFNSDFAFCDRYDGEGDYFNVGDRRYLAANNRQWIWETNFIPDARKAAIDGQEQKGAGVNLTQFEIADNTLIGHLAEWPVGRYHKAHYHGGGAVLVSLRSEGYSLMWPNEWGTRPYESGYGDRVVKIDWAAGSVFSPPTNWFHQHFNTGSEPALQLALRCGSQKFPLGIRVAAIRAGVYTSVKQGGTLIEYTDEDPEIRRAYQAELAHKGIEPDMNYAAAANDD
ncbi:MAG TPA: cupin domain-containing protein [Candidatus Binatia bacterium]|jgi:oxalate decarboxylase/phosphoglucose isomerase-like protein (cupin superfamily)|nr:cupin domain-containing protein [Candidatus Binatia bacterium]